MAAEEVNAISLGPHRFVAAYHLERSIVRMASFDGAAIDKVSVIALEDNGQRWGFVRRLWKNGREEDLGWMRLPSAFVEGSVFDTSTPPR